ncbi:YceI family protein [Aurantivibrio plasticivorans]
MKSFFAVIIASFLSVSQVIAADYAIDTKGAHASINFEIPHLGYSILVGRFDKFDGSFSYDAASPENASISVTIDTTSLNSNHAERDKHLKGKDFLYVTEYPEATFKSTRYTATSDTEGELAGTLTLRGVTKDIVIDVVKVGEGKDPWGGYRAGFSGSTSLKLTDFGIPTNLGPASQEVSLSLHIEGIRQ